MHPLMSPTFLFGTGLLWSLGGVFMLGLRAKVLSPAQLRTKLLGIVFVPSLVLLLVGGYFLVSHGLR